MSKEPLYPHIPKSKQKTGTLQIAGHNITDERIEDLLTDAFEGGSNYWYIIKKYNYPPGQTRQSMGIKFPHVEIPLKGGSLLVGELEGDTDYDKVLDRAAIERGLKLLAEKYPKHWADFLTENDDADTGDVFLQLALYGEVVFS